MGRCRSNGCRERGFVVKPRKRNKMTYIEIYEQYLTTMKSKYLPDGIDKLFELYKQELVDEQQILNILQGFKQAYTLASAQISRWTDETNLYVVWSCTSQACHELLKALQAFEPVLNQEKETK